jgi:hypothetical protein
MPGCRGPPHVRERVPYPVAGIVLSGRPNRGMSRQKSPARLSPGHSTTVSGAAPNVLEVPGPNGQPVYPMRAFVRVSPCAFSSASLTGLLMPDPLSKRLVESIAPDNHRIQRIVFMEFMNNVHRCVGVSGATLATTFWPIVIFGELEREWEVSRHYKRWRQVSLPLVRMPGG